MRNEVFNEDCLKTMQKMPDSYIDLTVTSPPYDKLRKYNGYCFDFESVARELFRVTKDGGVVVWIVGDGTVNGSETGTSFRQALFFKEIGFNLHDTMIYQKNKAPINSPRYQDNFEYMFVFSKGKVKTFNPILESCKGAGKVSTSGQRISNGKILKRLGDRAITKDKKKKTNIWYYYCGNGEGDSFSALHPARFPEKLALDHIISWSNEEDIVYDPFAGSGTTLKMAMLNKRNWIGSEMSTEYVEKIIKPRLAQHQEKTLQLEF